MSVVLPEGSLNLGKAGGHKTEGSENCIHRDGDRKGGRKWGQEVERCEDMNDVTSISRPGLGSCRLQRRQVTRAGEIGTQELWPAPCINHPALSEQHILGGTLTAK